MTLVRSTSLKVVSMAAVCCASTIRSAIRARSRVIGTRCSVRAPPPVDAAMSISGVGSPGVTFSSL